MNNHFWLGMALILASGVMNGGFALPMKYSRSWKWENTWLVYSLVALFLVPWTLAFGLVPGLLKVYAGVTLRALLLPVLFGLLWGTAQATFGISLRLVGVALTFAVVSGLASLSGSLVPLLAFNPADLFRPRGLLLLLSIPFLAVGLILYAYAGRGREKDQATQDADASRLKGSFATGMALCVFTGIFGSSFNLGFAFGGDVIRASLQQGAGSLTSTYAVWGLVLGAGFVPNLVYCVYLLVRNRTANLFRQSGWTREAILAVAMAFTWVTAILTYGIGATLVGTYGTSIGFMLFIASSILFANVFGLVSGEWKGTSSRTRKLLLAAVAFILVAVMVLNLGGLF
ncbi:MAG: L-rhamnose/proton symporter RhaT [Terriglobia bacterium]|jgi:L-rhamnose-H+ transport protein